jgi:hypothetical protein
MDVADKIALGSGVVAVVAAIISIWQARIAKGAADKQLKLTERIHREQSEPYVVVDIGPDHVGSALFVLSIHNTGPSMARNVRIQVTPELESTHANLTPRLARALARTIPVLPPGRRLVFAFDTNQRFKAELPMRFDFTVDADGPEGPVETLTYTVDLEVLAESLIGERPMKQLEKHLKNIEQTLGAVADAYQKANSEAIKDYPRRQWDELRQQGENGQF